MSARESSRNALQERLSEAARAGTPQEIIVVLRGKVRPVPGDGSGRWRVYMDGRQATFSTDTVVAATPLKRNGGPSR
jgi:hypothetical protein